MYALLLSRTTETRRTFLPRRAMLYLNHSETMPIIHDAIDGASRIAKVKTSANDAIAIDSTRGTFFASVAQLDAQGFSSTPDKCNFANLLRLAHTHVHNVKPLGML